jgi:biotin carboxyl carrier protein
VIEALKMENLVYAPCDGKVSEVRVKKGDLVEDDDVIMMIEEA